MHTLIPEWESRQILLCSGLLSLQREGTQRCSCCPLEQHGEMHTHAHTKVTQLLSLESNYHLCVFCALINFIIIKLISAQKTLPPLVFERA